LRKKNPLAADLFSLRSRWPTRLNPISRLLQEKHRQQTAIFDLTESNPTRCAFLFYSKDKLALFSDPKNLAYDPDPRGLNEAREAVCRYYAEKKVILAPHQIFLTSGTSEAYGFLFRLLADPGDEILASDPGYPLFETLADLNDVHLKKFSLVYGESWHIDQESLKQSFTARTKALLVIHPNNPTGHFVSEKERRVLHETCTRNPCAWIVDEVFLDYAWGLEGTAPSFAGQSDVLTFTLSGVSKILGLPQMKLSWIVVSGPDSLRAEALSRLEVIADAHLSVNTLSQRALPEWLNHRHSTVNEINERVSANFGFLKASLDLHPLFQLLQAEGGWYAVLKGPLSMNDEAFAVQLLQNKNVLVHPGFFFDFPGENFLVLSLIVNEKAFQEGIRRLCEELAEV
jgi:aspartate/methionine/tyrosine aminotransferase